MLFHCRGILRGVQYLKTIQSKYAQAQLTKRLIRTFITRPKAKNKNTVDDPP
jgi:hypothetical protein